MKHIFPLLFSLLLLSSLAACKGSREGNEKPNQTAETENSTSNSSNSSTATASTGESPDRLIFHTGVCFGACPEYCMSVDRQGQVEFWGGRFAKRSGYYTAQAYGEVQAMVNELLDSPDWDTLKTEYRAKWTDDRAVGLVRVIDGRMAHSMYDYGAQAGGVAQKSYELMNLVYESGGLRAMSPDLFTCWRFQEANFKVENSTYPVTRSEMFFLWQEWRRNAGNVQTTQKGPFEEAEEPQYLFGKNKIMGQDPVARYPNCLGDQPAMQRVFTNGKSFTIQYVDGGQTKIELGYDFFQENQFAFGAVDGSK